MGKAQLYRLGPVDNERVEDLTYVHQEHLTSENLHRKAEIAAELAYRDYLIHGLTEKNMFMVSQIVANLSAVKVTLERAIEIGRRGRSHVALEMTQQSIDCIDEFLTVYQSEKGENNNG